MIVDDLFVIPVTASTLLLKSKGLSQSEECYTTGLTFTIYNPSLSHTHTVALEKLSKNDTMLKQVGSENDQKTTHTQSVTKAKSCTSTRHIHHS